MNTNETITVFSALVQVIFMVLVGYGFLWAVYLLIALILTNSALTMLELFVISYNRGSIDVESQIPKRLAFLQSAVVLASTVTVYVSGYALIAGFAGFSTIFNALLSFVPEKEKQD